MLRCALGIIVNISYSNHYLFVVYGNLIIAGKIII